MSNRNVVGNFEKQIHAKYVSLMFVFFSYNKTIGIYFPTPNQSFCKCPSAKRCTFKKIDPPPQAGISE